MQTQLQPDKHLGGLPKKGHGSRPPARAPADRRRHSKDDEAGPEGARKSRPDPDEINPLVHRDTADQTDDAGRDPNVND